MKRFRLRFLLQEFDLVGAEVVVGRSPDCQVTIEDPLVSRQHARFRIEDEHVWVEDLESRNGVRVNGTRISGATEIFDGDRIRLGTQELVFASFHRRDPIRTTGLIRMCNACGVAYPEGARQCPHCGADGVDEDTISGLILDKRSNWTFHLLAEVIERALSSRRVPEADRMMRRAAREIEEILETGGSLELSEIAQMALFALRLAAQSEGVEWVRWSVQLHQRLATLPAPEVLAAIESLGSHIRDEVGPALGQLAKALAAHSSDRADDLERLHKLGTRAT